MKKYLSFLLILCSLQASVSIAYTSTFVFRDIPLGASLEDYPDMKKIQKGQYILEAEELILEQAKIEQVIYIFSKEKLSGLRILFTGDINYFYLRNHLTQKYGPPQTRGATIGWGMQNYSISITFKEEEGTINIFAN